MERIRKKECDNIPAMLERIERDEPGLLVDLMGIRSNSLQEICEQLMKRSSAASKKYLCLIEELLINHEDYVQTVFA